MSPTFLLLFMLSNTFLRSFRLSFPHNLKAPYLISRTFLEGNEVIIDSMKTGTLTCVFHPSFQVRHPDNFCALGFAVSLIATAKLSLSARSPQQRAGDLLC